MKKLTFSFMLSILILPTAFATSYRVGSDKEFEEITQELVAGDEVVTFGE